METVRQADRDRVEKVCSRLGLAGVSISSLEGGSRNRSYRLSDGRHDVVLRIDGEHDGKYAVERESEYAAQRFAARHGLAPRLLLAGKGHAVTEFVPNPPWSRERAASPEGSAEVGAWLARLHALPVPEGLRRVCFLASLEDYAAQLQDTPAAREILQRGRHVAAGLGDVAVAVCHNDLHHLNLIDAAHGLVAIDWEYAGLGDPRLDLAGYLAYHDLDGAATDALLAGYRPSRAEVSRGELGKARWLFESVWWAWLELRRRIEGTEAEAMAGVRNRLLDRLGTDGA